MGIENREHTNEEGHSLGFLSISYDRQTGQVVCSACGFWSVKQAQAFFEDWYAMIQSIHEAGQSVFALVDMSDGATQRPEVAEIILATARGLYREGDAIAMLVPSSLAKMQMRRLLDENFHDFFTSRDEAEKWLESRQAPHVARAAFASTG